jgi:hypothetical protein
MLLCYQHVTLSYTYIFIGVALQNMIPAAIKTTITEALARNRNLHQQIVAKNKFALHEECRNLCRLAIMSQHIEQYPQVLAAIDEQGNLPLHCLLLNKLSSIEDVSMMIDKYPAALQYRNSDGNLPLHIECRYQCRSSVISKCIHIYPKALVKNDAEINLPLHLILYNKSSSVEDVLTMIEKYPAALKNQNINGDFPFQIECKYQRRSPIIAKCIALHPEGLSKQAIHSMTYYSIDRDDHFPLPILAIIFTARPTSLYDYHTRNDVRANPYYRRKILNLLPRHVFTTTHETDYRDLNWQPRAAAIMLLSQMRMKVQQQR